MKPLSFFMNESLKKLNSATANAINECVIAARRLTINDKGEHDEAASKSYVIVKHRDRAYNVNCSIVHTVINGMEVVYLRDDDTGWSEGMNANGICIVNSSLSLADENIGTDKGKKGKDDKAKGRKVDTKTSADGEKIIKALTMQTIEDALHFAKTWKTGIHGNTIIANDDQLYTISSTSEHPAVTTSLDGLDTVVYTNHSDIHAEAGYTEGPNFKSSTTRKTKSEQILGDSLSTADILVNMREQPFKSESNLNPLRTTKKLATTSQMILDPKNNSFHLVIMKNYTENFKGIVDQLPSDFEPKIKITFEEK